MITSIARYFLRIVAVTCCAVRPTAADVSATSHESRARKCISLDGEWSFALDPGKAGEIQGWWAADRPFAERIEVPGCWQSRGIGGPKGSLRHHYEGPAWYKRQIRIPADWRGKTPWLVVGGAARRTDVYVNGKLAGSHDGFLTPFRIDIGAWAEAGAENTIALRVDNSGGGPVGCFNYAGNWGGVYRPVRMEATDSTWIDDVFIIPDVDRREAKVRMVLRTKETAARPRLELKVRMSPLSGGEKDGEESVSAKEVGLGASSELETEIIVALSDVRPWFPESPNLYSAEVTLSGDAGVIDARNVTFGMRNIDWSGGRLKINGRPYFLRGCGDDNVEVLTGLPPASKEFFLRRLALTRSMGFNAVRFHSNVPFEECFQAADEAGMLLQVELPSVYIFGFLPNKRHLREELVRILKAHRNHPSLFSLALGNEFLLGELDRWPAAKRQEFLDTTREFYALAKELDPTRPILSNSGEPKLEPTDIHSGAWPTVDRPFLCHEYGSYRGSLPDIGSAERFTGLFAPFRGVLDQAKWVKEHLSAKDYAVVLGNSQALLEIGRKNFLESARKDPRIDGYNYWLVTDFPGGIEGDAWYYGVFDQFWTPKRATPESMARINSGTVLLVDAEFGGRCFWADRERTFKILASHFGARPIRDGRLSWRLVSRDRILVEGTRPGISIEVGEIEEISEAKVGPLALARGEALELQVELKDSQGAHANSWTVWAFPRALPEAKKETIACQPGLAGALAAYRFIKPLEPAGRPGVLIAADLDGDARRHVREGGKLLLFPRKGSLPGQVEFPLFSSQQGVGPGTVIRGGPVMDRFPHGGFCDGQFLGLMGTGTAIDAGSLPGGLSPEAWGILPVRGETIGLQEVAMVFSGKMGDGKVLVCTFDVPGNLNEEHPEASCLFEALLDHAVSGEFQPEVELERWLEDGGPAK